MNKDDGSVGLVDEPNCAIEHEAPARHVVPDAVAIVYDSPTSWKFELVYEQMRWPETWGRIKG